MATMLLIAPLLVVSPSAVAETEDPAIIGFDFENGLSANESISLPKLDEIPIFRANFPSIASKIEATNKK